ncbi:hypothetical protein [Streptococcus sp. S784/96/1]|uniref:hypothetical protein n=1 Tax=Streptococcus sp. S784/96/1 TaxID=2653499 RepID=UPI001386B54E|nr:hypothetical protein [Streptococcus sp. S784/96/1]
MSYKRLSAKVLLGIALFGLCGQQCAQAEDIVTEVGQNIEAPYGLAIAVSNTLRSEQPIVDVVVNLPQKFDTAKVVTVELRNLVGEVMNTLDYTVPKGERRFTCWFGLEGLKEDSYHVTVSLPDGPVTHSGYSKGVTYTPKTLPNASSTKTSAPQLPSENASQNTSKSATATSLQTQQPSIRQGELSNNQDVTTVASESNLSKTDESSSQSVKQASASQKTGINLADRMPESSEEKGFSKIVLGTLIVTGIGFVSTLVYFIKKR